MEGAVLYGPRDVRFEERAAPTIVEPTDAIIQLSATCICGSDLWPYRGENAITEPTPMGHEYCGIVEDVGRGVTSIVERMTVNEGTLFELPSVIYQVSRLARYGRRNGQSTCTPGRVASP